MSFGIANNVRSEVRVCTPDLLNQALDSPQVAKVCAEIEDSLEKCRRGEIIKEEYIPIPTLEEQENILSYLDAKCEKIDSAINKYNNNCQKLIEYKKSLIWL